MLLFENELGWRLHKHRRGYSITRAHPPLRSRIWQFGPVFVNILLVAGLWLGRAAAVRYVLYGVAGLFVLAWLVGDRKVRRGALYAIPAVVIFLGLLARDDITLGCALGALPFSFLAGLWGFRPAVLYANVPARLVIGGDFFPRLPFSQCEVDIDHAQDTGQNIVYLRGTEATGNRPTPEPATWMCLAWEACTQEEASRMADEFRGWGIGVPDARQEEVIKANKKARVLVFAGYVTAVVVLIVVLIRLVPRSDEEIEQVTPEVILWIIRIVVGFVFLSAVPFGAYLGRLGWRAIKYRRMPPPGTIVIMNTKVLEGAKAVRRGRIVMAVAFVLVILGLVGGLYFPLQVGEGS